MNPDVHQKILEQLWNPWWCMLAVLVGMGLSFLKKGYDLEQTGTKLKPHEYWRDHPYQVALYFFSGYAFAFMCLINGLLNVPFALGIGICCDVAFDTLRTKAIAKMNDTGQQSGI